MKKLNNRQFWHCKPQIRYKQKKLIILFIVILFSFSSISCQPTPKNDVVVNKAETDIQNKIKNSSSQTTSESGNKVANLDIPNDNYIFSSKNEDESLTINVDAQIVVASTKKLPSAKVVPMQFTQEMVTGMFNYLFPNQKPYNTGKKITKLDIENEIIAIKRVINNGIIDGEPISDSQLASLNEEIKDLEKQHKTAPETSQSAISDGIMTYSDELGCDYLSVFIPNGASLSVMTNFNTSSPAIGQSTGLASSRISYLNTQCNFSMDNAIRITTETKLPSAAAASLKLSLKDAIAKADGLFQEAGINDAAVFSCYLVDNHGTGHADNSYDPASEYSYKLFYTRTLQGTSIAASADTGAYSENSYDVLWGQESIQFIIANDGIVEFTWMSPCKTVELIAEDVNIIDFQTAMNQFKKMVFFTYEPETKIPQNSGISKQTLNVSIDEIRLSPIRLKEKDHPGEYVGIYVPSYVFYGQIKKHVEGNDGNTNFSYDGYMQTRYSGNDFFTGPTIVFAINAIDGSTIDILGSY